MFKTILLSDKLDQACAALKRIADALDRAYPPEDGKLLVGHELIKTLGKEPLDIADNEATWLKELEEDAQRENLQQPPTQGPQ